MIRNRKITASCFAAALVFGLSLPLSPDRAEAATKIDVIVNKSVITSYEVANRARLLQLVQRGLSRSAAIGKARQELVEDKLKIDAAKQLKLGVDKERVDAAFATIAKRTKMSPQQLAAALRRSGVDPEELKRRILAQIAWSQVVRARFKATVKIEQQDVLAALRDKNSDEELSNETIEYTLYQIIFVVPHKAKPGMDATQRRAAEKLRAQFSSCSTDLDVARGLNEVVVKKVGIRNQADLNEEIRNRLEKVEVGHLTEMRKGDLGYEMLAVCDKKVLESNAAALSLLEDQMRREEGDRLSRRFLMELRRNANIQYR